MTTTSGSGRGRTGHPLGRRDHQGGRLAGPRRATTASPSASPSSPAAARATATRCSSTPRSCPTTSSASSARSGSWWMRRAPSCSRAPSSSTATGCRARVPHRQPQRHPHLRLRLLLQLSAPPSSASATISLVVDGETVSSATTAPRLLEVLREQLGPPLGERRVQSPGTVRLLHRVGRRRSACGLRDAGTPCGGASGDHLGGFDACRADLWANAFADSGASQCGFCTSGHHHASGSAPDAPACSRRILGEEGPAGAPLPLHGLGTRSSRRHDS